MHTASVALIGASGYSGIEATRILAHHPRAELRLLASDRWSGDTPAKRLGIPGRTGALKYTSIAGCEGAASECDAILLATPAEVSLEIVPRLTASSKARIVDLSGAFRLKDAGAYPTFYGFDHRHPQLLESAVYGLPELFRQDIPGARLIANPGCYPTGAALAVAPLLAAGYLDPSAVIIDAASGTTGAGRRSSEEMSFSEVDEDFRAYKVLRHQHTPEISQSLSRCASRKVHLTFTPHLLPVKRGILTTAYATLAKGRDPSEALSALKQFYRSEPFVEVLDSPDEVTLKSVVGTNRCAIGIAWDCTGLDPGRLVIVSAIDNLVKGAAGQAVQNLNLAMGWDEGDGLSSLRGFYP
jgi:N-acetyl-gamma-glutamyl-phosphate reductase